ncbi:hypothetical protein GGS23DRAFT_160792 [Durotheca rogersii]|uniref:uncharacterized protein n=1 Tax=Durotheca rogersii TaxID=419775 RepID=UPI002221172F|nr:uncharacterized protein GGS23DRAFT_160792 [Durotheca rogersii]KAI5861276.1 hypothetical protein GGS23DRAFT_160792 [Durotheca rogersii]
MRNASWESYALVGCVTMRASILCLSVPLAITSGVLGRPASRQPAEKCETPLIRREWCVSVDGKQDFISAVKCLQSRPGNTSDTFSGVKSRYDDFLALHITKTDYVHWVGHFLPWHRYYLWKFEQALRKECSYGGSLPYWGWAQDSDNETSILKSPIFHPDTGFGGNGPYIEDVSYFPEEWQTGIDIPGRSGGGCIADGPFAGSNISMGPGNHTEYNPHCLRRDMSPWLMTQSLNKSTVEFILNSTDYFELDHRIEGLELGLSGISIHVGGHLGIGGKIGEMSNTYSSPADPIFWLHHCAIDRLWDTWQRKDWQKRKVDIGGPDTQWAYPYDYYGELPYENVTLDFVMNFGKVAPEVKIREVMDIHDAPFCIAYTS